MSESSKETGAKLIAEHRVSLSFAHIINSICFYNTKIALMFSKSSNLSYSLIQC